MKYKDPFVTYTVNDPDTDEIVTVTTPKSVYNRFIQLAYSSSEVTFIDFVRDIIADYAD